MKALIIVCLVPIIAKPQGFASIKQAAEKFYTSRVLSGKVEFLKIDTVFYSCPIITKKELVVFYNRESSKAILDPGKVSIPKIFDFRSDSLFAGRRIYSENEEDSIRQYFADKRESALKKFNDYCDSTGLDKSKDDSVYYAGFEKWLSYEYNKKNPDIVSKKPVFIVLLPVLQLNKREYIWGFIYMRRRNVETYTYKIKITKKNGRYYFKEWHL